MRLRLAAAGLVLCLVVAVPCRAQPNKDIVPDLLKILKDSFNNNEQARFRALSTLVEMGPAAKAAVPDLVKIAGDTFNYDDKFTLKAIEGLKKIGPRPSPPRRTCGRSSRVEERFRQRCGSRRWWRWATWASRARRPARS